MSISSCGSCASAQVVSLCDELGFATVTAAIRSALAEVLCATSASLPTDLFELTVVADRLIAGDASPTQWDETVRRWTAAREERALVAAASEPAEVCACGCGKVFAQKRVGRTRLYASVSCRSRARRAAKNRAQRALAAAEQEQ